MSTSQICMKRAILGNIIKKGFRKIYFLFIGLVGHILFNVFLFCVPALCWRIKDCIQRFFLLQPIIYIVTFSGYLYCSHTLTPGLVWFWLCWWTLGKSQFSSILLHPSFCLYLPIVPDQWHPMQLAKVLAQSVQLKNLCSVELWVKFLVQLNFRSN